MENHASQENLPDLCALGVTNKDGTVLQDNETEETNTKVMPFR